MPTSQADVQQAVNIINAAPAAVETATMQYLQMIGSINTNIVQASTLAAGGVTDPTFNNMVQQAMGAIANMPSLIANAKGQINTNLDNIISASTELNNALQSMQNIGVSNQMNNQNSNSANAMTGQLTASRKKYNFKTAQFDNSLSNSPLLNDVPLEDNTEGFGPFQNAHELLQQLEGMDTADAENALLSYVSEPQGQEQIRKSIEMIFEHDLNSQEKLEVISQIWRLLPDAIKAEAEKVTPIEGTLVNNQGQTMANIHKIRETVIASNEEIKKLAQQNNNKPFNFRKEAQHKSLENVILWGPESKKIDPFTGEPISDWHVLERNKGWGFRIGDRWDIDFEAFWRGNIMDKYSRPYRDDEGNWVGGYIEKRFEVDRWQPEENKYMLKPGEKRKPRPAELGNLEARMEVYRGNKDKVFNWAKANSNKMIKTADGGPMGEYNPYDEPFFDGFEYEKKSNEPISEWARSLIEDVPALSQMSISEIKYHVSNYAQKEGHDPKEAVSAVFKQMKANEREYANDNPGDPSFASGQKLPKFSNSKKKRM